MSSVAESGATSCSGGVGDRVGGELRSLVEQLGETCDAVVDARPRRSTRPSVYASSVI